MKEGLQVGEGKREQRNQVNAKAVKLEPASWKGGRDKGKGPFCQ